MSVFRHACAGSCTALVLLCTAFSAPGQDDWEAFAKYEWPRLLSESGAGDHALVAALATTLPDVAAWKPGQFYRRALAARPDDPLTLYSAATWCFYSPDQPFCFERDLLQELAESDPGNGVPLLMQAVRALVVHDDESALSLVRHAARRPRLDSYWGRTAGLLRRVIRDTVPAHFGEPGDLAVRLALARPQVETGIHDVCTSPGAKLLDRQWNAACLKLGAALEHRGSSAFLARLGLSLQRRILELDDDAQSEALAALAARTGTLDELRQAYAREGGLGERFWSDLELYGELEALRRVAGESGTSNARQPGNDP